MAQAGRRKSVFRETGLSNDDDTTTRSPRRERPQSVRFRSKDEIYVVERFEDERNLRDDNEKEEFGEDHQLTTAAVVSPWPYKSHSMYRFGTCLLLLAVIVPLLQSIPIFGHKSILPIRGVQGVVIPPQAHAGRDIQRRELSPTDVCKRWAQQSALVNGTLYLYGGEASTQPGQTSNTWDNYFLTLDLTKTWEIGGPPLKGLPKPSGPPAVAEGYLWNSYDSLYLYGGEVSSYPPVTPPPFALWEYHIESKAWIEHSNPVTSSGKSAPENDKPVQRAAEGAGVSVPPLGRGFYFGGHLDAYTTPGWDVTIYREYLQSLLEFTFPGYTNSQVNSLSNGKDAGPDGVYRNITQGGLQSDFGFTKRADGLLIYIPGFGAQGILMALAGGTNVSFTQMNNINIYDIATSSWYTQATAGPTPRIRVNPCAVVAAAPDGSSYNVYMFGGQNLIPFGNQTQLDDMWILTLPSFQWIPVNQNGQSIPYGRSGATCNIWDAQMVMVGGYSSAKISCESPGIYVFDLSNLQWVEQFTALSAKANTAPSNPLNQQPNQRAEGNDPGGLQGSYGYEVPEAVISVIGGGKTGGATLTTPLVTATGGPLKTGSPVTYTVTGSAGAVITETGSPSSEGETSGSGHSADIAAIVVGVICGLAFIVICYLLFCLYVYRKQLKLYKRHVEMSQRQARGEKPPIIPGLWSSDNEQSGSEPKPGQNGLLSPAEAASQVGSHGPSEPGSGGGPSSTGAAAGGGYQSVRRDSDQSSTNDLLAGQEPTFVGVMLHPRRSLRVTNRD